MPISEDVWIQLIATGGVIITAFLGILTALVARSSSHAKAAARDSKAARDQVQNSHTTNLRVEQDERHDEIVHLVQLVSKGVENLESIQLEHGKRIDMIHSDSRGIKKDVGRISDVTSDLREQHAIIKERLHALELHSPNV